MIGIITVRAKPRYYAHTRNFYNEVLENMLNLVRAKPKLFKIAKLSMHN